MSLKEYLLEQNKGYTSTNKGTKGEHNHPYEVDNFGNGGTLPDKTGHDHKISEWMVLPGGDDSHGHMLSMLTEELGPSERSRMDFMTSELAQELLNSVKKIGNIRQIGKAHFGKELMKIEKALRKSQSDVNRVIEGLRQGWK